MAEQNIERPEWDMDSPDPPFRGRITRVGARAGASELGAALYEMDPGGAVSLYHVHHANEELLLVLSGRPRLRTLEGTRELQSGDVVAFPRGPRGAHRVFNPSGQPARVLIVSTMNFPEIAEHLDTGTLLAMTGPAAGTTFPPGSDIRSSTRPFAPWTPRASRSAADTLDRQTRTARPEQSVRSDG